MKGKGSKYTACRSLHGFLICVPPCLSDQQQSTTHEPLPVVLQRELTSKVQRLDALQAELNAAQAERAAADAVAAAAQGKLEDLESSLAQAQRQVEILSENTYSKESKLQQFKAELDAANNAKRGVEYQVTTAKYWEWLLDFHVMVA